MLIRHSEWNVEIGNHAKSVVYFDDILGPIVRPSQFSNITLVIKSYLTQRKLCDMASGFKVGQCLEGKVSTYVLSKQLQGDVWTAM